jgi:hypothetical protein
MHPSTAAEAPAPRKPALPSGLKPAGLTANEACAYIPCSRPKLFEYLNAGLIEKYYIGHDLRFTMESLEQLIEQLKSDARKRPSRSERMSEIRKRAIANRRTKPTAKVPKRKLTPRTAAATP